MRTSNLTCLVCFAQLHVRGSVHHSKIHKEKSNKMQQCIKIYYSTFIWSSTCFGRHTAHHQEPKTALAATGFAYVEGCWTCDCWTLSASSNHTSNNQNVKWFHGINPLAYTATCEAAGLARSINTRPAVRRNSETNPTSQHNRGMYWSQ